MKSYFLVRVGLSLCAFFGAAAKDTVIMTVGGEDVTRSEFEYLYNKNRSLQAAQLSPHDYLELFKVFRMKVADAKNECLDTLPAFVNEMMAYRSELALPYMTDSAYMESFVVEQARRGEIEIETNHIMLFKNKSAVINKATRARLDSIRGLVLVGEDFGDLAARFSEDRATALKKGSLGFITGNRYPYAFETAVYTTPEGCVSEVVESPVAYHIVKTGERRPSKGRARASHILKSVSPDFTEIRKDEVKHQIDSIYNIILSDPSIFADIARECSDDKGSASVGGDLFWFGSGDMVPEFEDAVFSLKDGEISRPVKSAFGWHIILRTGSKPSPGVDELREEVMRRINDPLDPRMGMIRERQTKLLAEKHGASIYKEVLMPLRREVTTMRVDSVSFDYYLSRCNSDEVLMTVDGRDVLVADLIKELKSFEKSGSVMTEAQFDNIIDSFINSRLKEAEESWLYMNVPDYRYLFDEYRDGTLMYEISARKVWNKASNDVDGLLKYFQSHRNRYKWKNPHVKGILVLALDDSVASEVRHSMESMPYDSITIKLGSRFKGQARIKRVLDEKGTDKLVDSIMASPGLAVTTSGRYKSCFLYGARVLDNPEEPSDVKARLIADYQSELERLWVEDLRKRYVVRVNEREFQKIK